MDAWCALMASHAPPCPPAWAPDIRSRVMASPTEPASAWRQRGLRPCLVLLAGIRMQCPRRMEHPFLASQGLCNGGLCYELDGRSSAKVRAPPPTFFYLFKSFFYVCIFIYTLGQDFFSQNHTLDSHVICKGARIFSHYNFSRTRHIDIPST